MELGLTQGRIDSPEQNVQIHSVLLSLRVATTKSFRKLQNLAPWRHTRQYLAVIAPIHKTRQQDEQNDDDDKSSAAMQPCTTQSDAVQTWLSLHSTGIGEEASCGERVDIGRSSTQTITVWSIAGSSHL